MVSNKAYPKLVINLNKIRHNAEKMKLLCGDRGVALAGVVKGCSGLFECAKQFEEAGCEFIASSRIEQLESLKDKGIQTPLMMIRIPMLSEAADVIRVCDISLNSEAEVLKALNKHAGLQDRKHRVILMQDLGDLREGFWDKEELISSAVMVENELHNLELAGIGTNLGCYGAVEATPEKLTELTKLADAVETKIGRELEYISERATSSLPRILDGNLPERINLLRIGETILLSRDLQDLWGYDMSYMYKNTFVIEAEIIEIKEKPTYPVGSIGYDCFGQKPVYEDRGIRRRAVIGLGRVDYGSFEDIIPVDEDIRIIGASSDHTILDVEDCGRDLKVGDIVEFTMTYAAMVYATNSDNLKKVYIN
ncbi:MAG: alanine racemase [Anaerovoracaceae bacterium]